MKFKLVSLCLFFSSLGLASVFSDSHHDVAVDLSNGETLVLQKFDNPTAKVSVLNASGVEISNFELQSQNNINAHYEIELLAPNRLLLRVQSANTWTIKEYTKPNDQWIENSNALTGTGILSELRTLPDGRLVAQLLEGSVAPQTLLIATEPQLTVLESIPTEIIQQKQNEFVTGHGLGFTAGLASGVGFAYRKHLQNKFGVQIGGIAWGDDDESIGNLGLQLIRTLSLKNNIRFYAVAAASVFYRNSEFQDFRNCIPQPPDRLPVDCVPEVSNRTTGTLNFGAGIGMEFSLKKNLGLSIELPLTVMLDLEKQTRWKRKGIYPVPSVSLVYYF